jgi:hypothetical protein
MCSLKTVPSTVYSHTILSLRYDAASISVAYLVPEFLDSCSRAKGSGPGDDHLFVQVDGTIGDDEIMTREERLRVLGERLAVDLPKGIGARDNKDDIDHEVEIGVGDTGVQDQAS